MFENVKSQLWDILKQKDVSLVMIFDKNGEILWSKGRKIEGKSIFLGAGFPKSITKKIISHGTIIQKENVEVVFFGDSLSQSALNLNIKNVIVLPVREDYFLYVDSGTKETFTETDVEVFRVLGELLGKMILKVLENEKEDDGITGVSKEIEKIRNIVLKYSLEEEPVLLLGETGVGKSHIAELIHRYSGRKGRFEVAEICSINENLFESTLFGHKKGAFTDAQSDRAGLVKEAGKGTLFIDEISEIPIASQAKLLRFIEKKKYRVLGDSRESEADVRIVAASNRNLQEAINEKIFREDLYYRLHVLEVEIPPLRERKEDVKEFINRNLRYLKGKEIGEGFWVVILNYDWPGNMRELITVMKRAGILLDSPITGEKITEVIYGTGYPKSAGSEDPWKENILKDLEMGKTFWEVVKEPYLNRELNRTQVKTIIAETLAKTSGNYKNTLKFLNIEEEDYSRFMKFLYRNSLS
ncbi:MAG: sigma-54-dependent Fis family transcriptional regulator [bacterium]|nr:sigma-54-dependent Fis family transcriptional regulator [bacterium]